MSIASELTNLENNIGDSYDAVDDMGGVIPAHKNMANLDQAIRTIPQNSGITATTFHWGGSPNYSMYKDSGYTTAATYSDIATAYAGGLVYIADGEDEVTYVVVSDIPDAHTITVTGIGLPGYEGASASYAYASSTWTKTATEFQKKLTAGTGINISAQNVISATGGDAVTDLFITDTLDTFAVNDSVDIYTDEACTTRVSWSNFYDLVKSSQVRLICTDSGDQWYNAYYVLFDYDNVAGYSSAPDEPGYYAIDLTYNKIYELDWTNSSATAPSIIGITELQQKLTAGLNISIAGNTISATDTTYSAFTGATSSVAGAAGLVPAPTTSDPDKFLKGDGTWGTPAGGGGLTETIFYLGEDPFTHETVFSIIFKDEQLTTRADWDTDIHPALEAGPVILRYGYPIANNCVAVSYNDLGVVFDDTINRVGHFFYQDSFSPPTFYHEELRLVQDDFIGATSSMAGTDGLVPAPAAGDQSKVLLGDGTWSTVTGGMLDYSSAAGTAVIKTITDNNGRTGIYFSDGTLITTRKVQWTGNINASWGTLYEGHTSDYYKFAPTGGGDFIAEPNVQVTLLNEGTSGSCWLGAWEKSTQIVSGGWAIPAGALCFIRASTMNNAVLNFYIQAIGRWKA